MHLYNSVHIYESYTCTYDAPDLIGNLCVVSDDDDLRNNFVTTITELLLQDYYYSTTRDIITVSKIASRVCGQIHVRRDTVSVQERSVGNKWTSSLLSADIRCCVDVEH